MTCFTQKFHHQRTNNTFLIEKCLAFLAEDDHKRLYKSDLCLFACHTWSEWVDDGKVAIAANGHHCVSWDENGNGLRETDNSAHDRTEWPVEQDKCRNERERNAENRHQDVTGRHIDNKKVGHLFFLDLKKKECFLTFYYKWIALIISYRPFANACENNCDHNQIADERQNEYHQVKCVNDDLEKCWRDERIHHVVRIDTASSRRAITLITATATSVGIIIQIPFVNRPCWIDDTHWIHFHLNHFLACESCAQ